MTEISESDGAPRGGHDWGNVKPTKVPLPDWATDKTGSEPRKASDLGVQIELLSLRVRALEGAVFNSGGSKDDGPIDDGPIADTLAEIMQRANAAKERKGGALPVGERRLRPVSVPAYLPILGGLLVFLVLGLFAVGIYDLVINPTDYLLPNGAG